MIDALRENESALIDSAKNGDRNAFSELVCLHVNPIMQILYRMYGDQHLAEDATQKAFIQAWLKLPNYQPKTAFRNWLIRIAINTAIDMLRKEKRILAQSTETMNLVDHAVGPETTVINNERAESIRQAILSLPEASRTVLILREYEELSYQEIADMLDIPLGTVMSRLNYARKILRKKLEDQLRPSVEAIYV
ncbi:MAG: sigma-70 family RNA polymerase sigma factor [Anaerolineaceae bacterium]|nr:sigma-70 family RNA polymerase sigma factor [Anaerolineaceae bacterium]